MNVGRTGLVLLAVLASGAWSPARAQIELASDGDVVRRPFGVGERLTWSVKVGPLGKGNAVAEILNVDTVRGNVVYHSVFRLTGSLLFFKVNDFYESWFDPISLVSVRYHQNIDQGSYERLRKYEIYAERGVFFDPVRGEIPTVGLPLDDGSFLYFLRSIPLKIGETYTFNRYFKPDRNPVTVTVVRRERIRVPAGEFDAIVIRPKIKAKGIFAEDANAEVWISDDENRMMLQMKTKLPFGGVQFQLRSREIVKESLAVRAVKPDSIVP